MLIPKPARLTLTLGLAALLAAPAHAWVPKLEDTTARNVIDGAYGRRDPVPTYLITSLKVKDGQFEAGEGAVTAFDGGAACVADWLAAPQDYARGSRPVTVTASGQADQLFFQAQDARDNFRNLSAADALTDEYASKRLPDGQLRIDIAVQGLPSERARGAYLVRLKGADGKLIAPVKSTYVNDFKEEGGTWSGTLVYYFEPLKAGLGASDTVSLLLRTEADTNCAYSVPVNLGKFS
ncbi:hypothetical protein GCM10008959_13540 [Deinococcus seoulensis]|uniref:DUF4198 domain-containing protein n=2 Tax=Deinococcus TaxID=1298 RepID=A0ABQ2RNW4_9DEIO|nr:MULTISPECIES: hypothetical protein [Deinococcus]GGR53260.1 hypothetical protein GCM10008959_13540 [Deinococcus seoulensis]GGS31152.1 hypothetical protein GCM10008961_23710 [Deinococcus knuensis]